MYKNVYFYLSTLYVLCIIFLQVSNLIIWFYIYIVYIYISDRMTCWWCNKNIVHIYWWIRDAVILKGDIQAI